MFCSKGCCITCWNINELSPLGFFGSPNMRKNWRFCCRYRTSSGLNWIPQFKPVGHQICSIWCSALPVLLPDTEGSHSWHQFCRSCQLAATRSIPQIVPLDNYSLPPFLPPLTGGNLLTHATPRAQLQYTVVATLYPALHRAQLQYPVAATSTRYTACSTTVHCRSYFFTPRFTALNCSTLSQLNHPRFPAYS